MNVFRSVFRGLTFRTMTISIIFSRTPTLVLGGVMFQLAVEGNLRGREVAFNRHLLLFDIDGADLLRGLPARREGGPGSSYR
ncbi:MAG: hypothetical protein XE11_1602 [Methanomicrobiales archaeon 53_19]|nr:MAG: hypothetical protein XD88_1145 [Methanocalculus sp. 52_23]KUL02859.1 MAG: hypothetical protein XE11_1602 [Methanomicrobiales archaeon 53_19]